VARVSAVTATASAHEALEMIRTGLARLAATDPTQYPDETQALILRELEQDDAALTAARAWSLAAFTAGKGYSADADYSPRAWLMHHTQVTRGAAAAHTAWARRAGGHRLVLAASRSAPIICCSVDGGIAAGSTTDRVSSVAAHNICAVGLT
jgi:hypothetical protein